MPARRLTYPPCFVAGVAGYSGSRSFPSRNFIRPTKRAVERLSAGIVFRLEVLSQSEFHSDLQNARLRGCWPEWYSGLRPSPSRNIVPTYKNAQNVELLAGMVFRLEVLSQSEFHSDLQNAQLIGCWPEWYSGLRPSPSRNIVPTYKARRMWGCWPEWYSGSKL